jgi:hypothetical protein
MARDLQGRAQLSSPRELGALDQEASGQAGNNLRAIRTPQAATPLCEPSTLHQFANDGVTRCLRVPPPDMGDRFIHPANRAGHRGSVAEPVTLSEDRGVAFPSADRMEPFPPRQNRLCEKGQPQKKGIDERTALEHPGVGV